MRLVEMRVGHWLQGPAASSSSGSRNEHDPKEWKKSSLSSFSIAGLKLRLHHCNEASEKRMASERGSSSAALARSLEPPCQRMAAARNRLRKPCSSPRGALAA